MLTSALLAQSVTAKARLAWCTETHVTVFPNMGQEQLNAELPNGC